MRQSDDSDYQRTLRVMLSHPEVGDIGEGSLTFGYSGMSSFVLDGWSSEISLSAPQLAEGLLAQAVDGTQLSLFDCESVERTLFPAFVVAGKVKDPQFLSFEVRYSNVSEWFFQQLSIDGRPGEKLEWSHTPTSLVAEADLPGLHFKTSSFYVGSIEHQGEDRNLHQHFEFRFTATQGRFALSDVKQCAHQFSSLLAILMGHPCSILSVDVSVSGDHGLRLFYGVSQSPPSQESSKDGRTRVSWRTFLTQKSDVEACWDDIVKRFFRSEYREVIWSRVAGMQNYEGFWEYRVLGYVSLLDSYVSQTFKRGPPTQQTRKLQRLQTDIDGIKHPLSQAQKDDVMNAAKRIFSVNDTFASKFQKMLDTLDPDVLKVINLSSADFDIIKDLRDEIAHGLRLSSVGTNITPILVITNRIILILMNLFFIDIGLTRDVFLRCLGRPLNKWRVEADIDEVHLDRILKPTSFFKVSTQMLDAIRQRPRGLIGPCFAREKSGLIAYSESYSEKLDDAVRDRLNGPYYKLLGLPEEAVTPVGKAYFEAGTQMEVLHSVVLIDLARIPS